MGPSDMFTRGSAKQTVLQRQSLAWHTCCSPVHDTPHAFLPDLRCTRPARAVRTKFGPVTNAPSRSRPLIRAVWPLRCPASACIEAFTLLLCSPSPSQQSLHSCTRLHTVCDMHKLMALLDWRTACKRCMSKIWCAEQDMPSKSLGAFESHVILLVHAQRATQGNFALRFRTRGGCLLQLGC